MFEKEAEEYRSHNTNHYDWDDFSVDDGEAIEEAYQKGAEFGYNLAKEEIDYLNKHWGNGKDKYNEWHYVKDGDLPKEEGDFLFYLYDKETKDTFCDVLGIARTYADRDDMHIESMLWTLDDVIAWKEIVIPELKESE